MMNPMIFSTQMTSPSPKPSAFPSSVRAHHQQTPAGTQDVGLRQRADDGTHLATSRCRQRVRWSKKAGYHKLVPPPSDVCWLINPMNTIYIYDRSTINHSEIGVTGTNLAKYVTSTTEYMNNMWYIIVSKNVTYVFFGDVLWTCWKQGCLNNILMYNTYVYIYIYIYLKIHKICFCYDCYDMNMHVYIYIYINMIGMGMLDEQRCWGIFWHHRKSWRTYLASFKSYIHFIPLIST